MARTTPGLTRWLLAAARDPEALPDAHLLHLFRARRDEEAFARLVRRHGPAVYAVCRRLLGASPDADDAFQATFVVLARKADTLARPDRLAAWLRGVAVRTARKARFLRRRRFAVERPFDAATPEPAVAFPPDRDDALARELAALPEAHRRPLVLCDLEGLSRAEAALRLGLPEGTLSSRLARARQLLRRRLVRAGAVPASLVSATIRAATTSPAPNVAVLVEGVTPPMVHRHLRFAVVAALAALSLTGGAVWFGNRTAAEPPPAPAAPATSDPSFLVQFVDHGTVASDRDRLQGTWELVELDGRPATAEDRTRNGGALTFKGDYARYAIRNGTVGTWHYRLDTAATPKRMDWLITLTNAPEHVYRQWIYKLEDDALTLCGKTAETAVSDPPEEFKAAAVQKTLYFSLFKYRRAVAVVVPAKPEKPVTRGGFELLNAIEYAVPVTDGGTVLLGGLKALRSDPADPDAPSADAVFLNTRTFAIPFQVGAGRLKADDAIWLFASADKGRTWVQVQVASPGLKEFRYTAADDGEYWFAVHTRSEDIRDIKPSLKVVIDTKPPQVTLRREPNTNMVAWKVEDRNLDLGSLKVEYMEPASAGWRLVAVKEASGTFYLPDGTSRDAAVRVTVRDKAGNSTVATDPVQKPVYDAPAEETIDPPDVVNIEIDGGTEAVRAAGGEHLVRPDGTVALGQFGAVPVAGKGCRAAAEAIRHRLADAAKTSDVRVRVTVTAFNSKVCYLIVAENGSEQVYRLPVKGGDMLADVLKQVAGLAREGNRIRVTRPGAEITIGPKNRDRTVTQFPILPGDRIYVEKAPR